MPRNRFPRQERRLPAAFSAMCADGAVGDRRKAMSLCVFHRKNPRHRQVRQHRHRQASASHRVSQTHDIRTPTCAMRVYYKALSMMLRCDVAGIVIKTNSHSDGCVKDTRPSRPVCIAIIHSTHLNCDLGIFSEVMVHRNV